MREWDRDLELGAGEFDAPRHPDEAREIDAVIALLRSLPDPEPEADLTARVMEQVVAIERRPRLLRSWIRNAEVPALLAASVACIAVGISVGGIRLPDGSDRVLVETPQQIAPTQGLQARTAVMSPVSYATAMGPTALFGPSEGMPPVVPQAELNPMDRHLDAELNALQLDPSAYLHRLERVRERERFVQRLAERAARRGDAAQVALSFRAVPHEYTTYMVEQFLHASLVRYMGEDQPH